MSSDGPADESDSASEPINVDELTVTLHIEQDEFVEDVERAQDAVADLNAELEEMLAYLDDLEERGQESTVERLFTAGEYASPGPNPRPREREEAPDAGRRSEAGSETGTGPADHTSDDRTD